MLKYTRGRIAALLLCGLLILVSAACSSAAASTQSSSATVIAAMVSTATAETPTTTQVSASNDGAQSAQADAKLNLNTATSQDFLTIPGLGNRMVREFEEYRPYSSILQFRKEIGKYVSTEQVSEYEQYVYVPISVNESDTATLQQIAGLDDGEAAALVAGRPYTDTNAFLTALAQYVSGNQLETAKGYLVSQ